MIAFIKEHLPKTKFWEKYGHLYPDKRIENSCEEDLMKLIMHIQCELPLYFDSSLYPEVQTCTRVVIEAVPSISTIKETPK